MGDKFRIDSHKLIYHPKHVVAFLDGSHDWEKAKNIYPIYVELSPMGTCNHRCIFCAYDYIGYEPVAMNEDAMIALMREMGKLGVKSVHLAGEGEPLLHKQIVAAINAGYEAGLDFGITTNGTLINDRFIQEALGQVTWLKVSMNAGTSRTYTQIHRCKPGDFDKVIKNLQSAVEYKRRHGLATTIGAQAILLPENAEEMEILAKVCRDEIGLDYLVIKPYSQHFSSNIRRYDHIDYNDYLYLDKLLSACSTSDFQLIFRSKTMQKYAQPITDRYSTCYSTPFFQAHIMTSGELYSCPSYLKDERFFLGNVFETSFQEVWQSEKRKANIQYVQHGLDISECRHNCHMDQINVYLSELKENRVPHVNFI